MSDRETVRAPAPEPISPEQWAENRLREIIRDVRNGSRSVESIEAMLAGLNQERAA